MARTKLGVSSLVRAIAARVGLTSVVIVDLLYQIQFVFPPLSALNINSKSEDDDESSSGYPHIS
jgi:hypothetical protein